MRKINKATGEINSIKVKGLWSPFPIPAYQVLARQGEWQAQRVMACLVSYLGDDGFCVFPSYRTIARTCGISQNGIRQALDVLEDNGFIRTYKFSDGKKSRNKYFFQASAWDSGKMNSKAKQYRPRFFKCLDCKEELDAGGFGEGPLGKVHWGCGGPVRRLRELN
jgi:hypothetical protein